MSMSLGCYQRLEQRHTLTQDQKLGLKHLLLLQQELRHPEIPEALRGLEGMRVAHEILQARNATGILIGGLAEAVWNRRAKPEDLLKHKDVDVAVLDDDFKLKRNFEGGIDWWMPKSAEITIRSYTGTAEGIEKRWHENGHGVVLSFGMKRTVELSSGLYIPDSEWVVDMRTIEADANVDYARINADFDDEVFEKFRNKIRKRVKWCLPKFIQDEFADYVLTQWGAVELEGFDLDIISSIYGIGSAVGDSVDDVLEQE